MKKMIFRGLGCAALTAFCLLIICGLYAYRFMSTGVNPYREIRMAVHGESIEIKDLTERDGRVLRQLLIDEIDHGTQFQNEKPNAVGRKWRRAPTSYYHSDGPVGFAFSKMNWFSEDDHTLHASDARLPASLCAMAAGNDNPWGLLVAAWSEPPVAVIMMNAGTIAAYARPLQSIDFYESNPKILELSFGRDKAPPQFSYIEDAKKRGAAVRVFEGKERRTFDSKAPKHFYHLLVMDTSRGHPGLPSKELLTKEAWQSYFESLTEAGVVCVHVSSRDFRLEEIVASTTADLGLAHLLVHDRVSDRESGHYTSSWVVVARREEMLKHIHKAADSRKALIPAGRPFHEDIDVIRAGVRPGNVWIDAGANSLVTVRR